MSVSQREYELTRDIARLLIKNLEEDRKQLRAENETLRNLADERLGELNRLRTAAPPSFQARVQPWLTVCFGPEIANDKVERNHRFIEEAIELVQALGCTRQDCHELVDYVFERSLGEPAQEVGGVMVTLAALCLASGLDMHAAAEAELARVWTKLEAIRAKQATKPKGSPLPQRRL